MRQTTDCLGNHPKSHLQHWSNQLWLSPRGADRLFSVPGKFSQLSQPVLARFDILFSLYPSCPVWILCILSVVKAWAGPYSKASFSKMKTSSKWSIFSAQHSLGNIWLLPGAVAFINLNAIFYISLKLFKITYLCRIQSLCI